MSGDNGTPGVFPHQLATWWEHGAGAARIAWGLPAPPVISIGASRWRSLTRT